MTNYRLHAQSSKILVVTIILLLVALGYIGWRMFTGESTEGKTVNASTKSSAEVILTQEDLKAAEKSLDELDFLDEDAGAAELQAEL